MEDTFKLADEVRAENRGEVFDPETGTSTPIEEVAPEVAPEATPAEVPPATVDDTKTTA